jgi:hypothetical protein
MPSPSLRVCIPTLVLLFVLLGSCTDGPTEPQQRTLVVAASDVVLTEIGARHTIQATLNGAPATSGISVSPGGETPAHPNFAVASLSGRTLEAIGPGVADFVVSASNAEPVTVRLRVEPASPVVLGHRILAGEETDTLVLDGYRLDEAGAPEFGEEALPVLSATSLELRSLITASTTEVCDGTRLRGQITLDGIAGGFSAEASRRHRDGIRLAPGEWIDLTPAEAECLWLEEGSYLLSWMDQRGIEYSRTGPEHNLFKWSRTDGYSVAISDVTHGGEIAEAEPVGDRGHTDPWPSAHEHAHSHGALEVSATLADDDPCLRNSDGWAIHEDGSLRSWWHDEHSWTVGDILCGHADPAYEVVYVEPAEGWLVLVIPLHRDAELQERYDRWLPAQIEAVEAFMAHGADIFAEVLEARRPRSSPHNGQIVFIGASANLGVGGSMLTSSTPYGPMARGVLGTTGANVGSLMHTLGHEIAHAWIREYLYADCGTDCSPLSATTSAEESVADLLSFEAVRRVEGVATMSGYPFQGSQSAYASLSRVSTQALHRGYRPGALMLTHMVESRARAGEDWDRALTQVVRGAIEGWHGYGRPNPVSGMYTVRTGLSGRMQNLLPGWDMGRAALDAFVAMQIDGRSDRPAFSVASLNADPWDINGQMMRTDPHRILGEGWHLSAGLDLDYFSYSRRNAGHIARYSHPHSQPWGLILEDAKSSAVAVRTDLEGLRIRLVGIQPPP